jgi:hypothetical protein
VHTKSDNILCKVLHITCMKSNQILCKMVHTKSDKILCKVVHITSMKSGRIF